MNKITDNLGNEYESVHALARAYGIPYHTLFNRLKRGLNLDKCLTAGRLTSSHVGILAEDHLKNRYKSIKEMCTAHNIKYPTFISRLNSGRSIEECLCSGQLKRVRNLVVDHKGIQYYSIAEMARAYGVKCDTVQARLKRGWSVTQALTRIVSKSLQVVDHKGNKFNSYRELAKAYNIPYGRLMSRIDNRCWSIEKALTTPLLKKKEQINNGIVL